MMQTGATARGSRRVSNAILIAVGVFALTFIVVVTTIRIFPEQQPTNDASNGASNRVSTNGVSTNGVSTKGVSTKGVSKGVSKPFSPPPVSDVSISQTWRHDLPPPLPSATVGSTISVGGLSKALPVTPSDPRVALHQLYSGGMIESVRIATLSPLMSETVAPFWVAFPDKSPNPELEGADWYDQVYRDHHFGAQEWYEEMLKHAPCRPPPDGADYFVQIGSHLGVFTFFGAAYGCRVVAVDTFDWTVLFMRLTAALNGWSDRFIALNAAGGSGAEGPSIVFDPSDTSVKTGATASTNDAARKPSQRTREVPVITLDQLRRELKTAHTTAASAAVARLGGTPSVSLASKQPGRIHFCVVDVEGFEKAGRWGARELIASREVVIWNIEVWFRRYGVDRLDPVQHHSGMQLLFDAGYIVFGLYSSPTYEGMSVLHPLKSVKHMIQTAPQSLECIEGPGGDRNKCLVEVFAVREDAAAAVARVNIKSGRTYRAQR